MLLILCVVVAMVSGLLAWKTARLLAVFSAIGATIFAFLILIAPEAVPLQGEVVSETVVEEEASLSSWRDKTTGADTMLVYQNGGRYLFETVENGSYKQRSADYSGEWSIRITYVNDAADASYRKVVEKRKNHWVTLIPYSVVLHEFDVPKDKYLR